MASYYGVDLSSNDGLPDWSKIKDISFAILRVTELYGIDGSFEHNYAGAKAAGIKVGGYRFSYAESANESRREAEGVVSTLAGRGLDLPIFIDLEWEKQTTFGKEKIGEIIEAFREVVEKAGYKFGIYTNRYWCDNYIPEYAVKKYDMWLAAVPSEEHDDGIIHETLRPSFGVGWQYSWNGFLEGFKSPLDMDVFYTDYSDAKSEPSEIILSEVTADDALNLARKWLGRNEDDGTHKMIIDVYNSHKPLARGYKVQYDDQWCDTFLSALFVKLDAVNLIGGTECGVEEHVKIFEKAGIWNEDGTVAPEPGDIIVFNWDDNTQPNDGFSDHIGIVESCDGSTITTIEGNYRDSVKRRTLNVGNGCIRGYARPKYAKPKEEKKEEKPSGLSKKRKWVGKVSASVLNVRSWAGTEFPKINSWPTLERGNLVDVCDTLKDSAGREWYYICIQGHIYGFCSATYIQRM